MNALAQTRTLVSPRWELAGRLAVTAGGICVYLLAMQIPLPGLDHAALATLSGYGPSGAIARLSIGALGVIPLFTALAIAELVRLLGPDSWNAESKRHGFAPDWVLWLALIFAGIQASQIAAAIEQSGGGRFSFVAAPSLQFRLMCVVSMTTVTALYWWLATMITRHGLGAGFWVLFVTLSAINLATSVPPVIEPVRLGVAPMSELAVLFGYTLVSVAFVVYAYVTFIAPDRAGLLLWPSLLAPQAMALLLIPVSVVSMALSVDLLGPLSRVMTPGHWLWTAVVAAFTTLFVLLYNARSGSPLPRPQIALVAAGLVVIVAAPLLLNSRAVAIVMDGATLVGLTVVALKLFENARAVLQRGRAATAERI